MPWRNSNPKGDCTTALAPFFSQSLVKAQFVGVLRTGEVLYTQQKLYPYQTSAVVSFLTNGDPWSYVSNKDVKCSSGYNQQFYASASMKFSFYDSKGIQIYPDGQVYLSPLWANPLGDQAYRFNLTCNPGANVFHGFSQGHYFSFTFNQNRLTGDRC
ncbi:hypothetical protein SAMD00019534_074870 [Acytostelium subglobosum LB1]|uniref:hypothetical protein n=1 Tax=Acytostelium subglobosum LB1 TaxID=1410327 RepID=UPI0006450E44|nr:hypothetical protein SAMD00019534_074870 [Acytostelium subglobosum LB1]GAM24312.1 hypothetical protein SAMD00019534_074870 [Acytostelium subglobosum LB1]|eukprot:XP_012752638.1 hypothetical protein SAMD00019534_074870 [Acytostelium subglobosum LB1]